MHLDKIDLICMHSKEGDVQPLRLRVTDEEGILRVFSVKDFRDLSHHGARTMPDGVCVSDKTIILECKIEINGQDKIVRIYSNPPYLEWVMSHQ